MSQVGNEELKQLSKASIQEAFLLLLEKKTWHEISIQDIIRKSGVSRMTYYRHFDSKEDILIQLFDAFLQTIADHTPQSFTKANKRIFLTKLFTVIKEYRKFIRILIMNDQYIGMIHRTNHFYLKQTATSGQQPFKLIGFIGFISNVCFHWVRQDCQDSLEELVETCLQTIHYP